VKMSFIPGQLELNSNGDSFFITIQGKEVFSTRSRRAALARFNEIRKDMEEQFPASGATPDDMKAMLERMLSDVAVDETLRRPPKKRSTARSSRTFGG
jgi:hypothetical protein